MRLDISDHRVPWPELTESVVVGHLTDVHVGPTTPWSLIDRALEAVADVDLLVLTGDYVNALPHGARRLGEALAPLPMPKVAVLGNHDHLAGAKRVTASLERGGVRVLRNESTEVGPLTIVGVDDGFTRRHEPERAFDGISDRRGCLVLTHHPPQAPTIAEHGGRVILAGHTHGGRVYVPGFTEWFLPGQPYLRGWHDVGEARLYVGRGLGHPWFRFNADPEVARFTLHPA